MPHNSKYDPLCKLYGLTTIGQSVILGIDVVESSCRPDRATRRRGYHRLGNANQSSSTTGLPKLHTEPGQAPCQWEYCNLDNKKYDTLRKLYGMNIGQSVIFETQGVE
ncbi:uncharacterized protein FFB14_06387 [Fusarium fujikuroi]|nr:uncharacterized protein FFB14_06387 [Fusarium fujikuroi]